MSTDQFPRAVLWDLDGTLIDSEPYWQLAEQQLATRYSSNWSAEDGKQLVGLGLVEAVDIMRAAMAIEDQSTQEIIDFLTDIVLENLRKQIPWRPGALELLTELRDKSIKTALVTMSLRRMAIEVVDAIGFDAFDLVVAGDDCTFGKPHPEPYLKAAHSLGFLPEHCIAIEDSINGLTSAEAAGTVAIAVPHLIDIPAKLNRNILPTLQGVNVSQLSEYFI